MSLETHHPEAGEELIKRDLITREDLDKAKEREAQSGTPWYKQLIQMRKVTFEAVEGVLRYELFHSKAARAQSQTLGNVLVKTGDLSEEDLTKALAEQKRTGRLLGIILLKNGYVTEETIGKALARQYDMEYAELDKTPSGVEALQAVPQSMARTYDMIPVALEGDKLTVLVTSPQSLQKIKDAAVLLGLRIQAILTSCGNPRAEITKRYKDLKEDPRAAGTLRKSPRNQTPDIAAPMKAGVTEEEAPTVLTAEERTTEEKAMQEQQRESRRFEEIAKEASGSSVIKMVSTIIEGAVNSGATDVHLDPQEPEMRVRYRIDGILHDVMSIPENIQSAVVSRIKIISDLDITESRHPQDGHISMEIADGAYDVRVATLPTFLGERVVLRLLDQTSILSGIKDLGLEPEDEEKLLEIIAEPYGMILVTGPTGSGKTTTLYAALNQKNVMTDSIVTLEDPVEYQLSGINQVQIDTDINLTFANTLRAALRQDIDVLLVGEIRDKETARIAIRAAMTGHLVFSTLHTNDAPEAISTLRNMDVPSYLISSALTAVLGQRLVRTICPDCRTEFTPEAMLLQSLKLPETTEKLYRGKGCNACYGTGNRGRTGIFEILDISPEVRRLIAEDESVSKIAETGELKTMAMRCRQKVEKGIVSPEEFLRVIRT